MTWFLLTFLTALFFVVVVFVCVLNFFFLLKYLVIDFMFIWFVNFYMCAGLSAYNFSILLFYLSLNAGNVLFVGAFS